MRKMSSLLIEDSLLFRYAFEKVLQEAGFRATTLTSEEAWRRKKNLFGAVLFDIVTFAGREDEIEALIQKFVADAPVLLLGREDRAQQVFIGLRAGAAGCVSQVVSQQELRRAIATIMAGGVWCEKNLFRQIIQYATTSGHAGKRELTKREKDVLRHVLRGETNREIARALGLSEQAIKVHVSNLLRKTGMSNRTRLSLHTMEHGLLRAW